MAFWTKLHSEDHPLWNSPFFFPWNFVVHSEHHPFHFSNRSLFCILRSPILKTTIFFFFMEVCFVFWTSPISFSSWKFVFAFWKSSSFLLFFLPWWKFCFAFWRSPVLFVLQWKFVMNFTITFAFSFPPNEVCSSGLSYLSGGLIDCAIRCQHSFCGITDSSWVLIFKHKFRLWAFHRQINRYWISFLPTFYKYFKPFHSIHRITLLISSITL